jgi:hypothetical protein
MFGLSTPESRGQSATKRRLGDEILRLTEPPGGELGGTSRSGVIARTL